MSNTADDREKNGKPPAKGRNCCCTHPKCNQKGVSDSPRISSFKGHAHRERVLKMLIPFDKELRDKVSAHPEDFRVHTSHWSAIDKDLVRKSGSRRTCYTVRPGALPQAMADAHQNRGPAQNKRPAFRPPSATPRPPNPPTPGQKTPRKKKSTAATPSRSAAGSRIPLATAPNTPSSGPATTSRGESTPLNPAWDPLGPPWNSPSPRAFTRAAARASCTPAWPGIRPGKARSPPSAYGRPPPKRGRTPLIGIRLPSRPALALGGPCGTTSRTPAAPGRAGGAARVSNAQEAHQERDGGDAAPMPPSAANPARARSRAQPEDGPYVMHLRQKIKSLEDQSEHAKTAAASNIKQHDPGRHHSADLALVRLEQIWRQQQIAALRDSISNGRAAQGARMQGELDEKSAEVVAKGPLIRVSAGRELEESEQVLMMERLARADGNRSNNSAALSPALAQSLTGARGGRLTVVRQGVNAGPHFLVVLPMPASEKDAARVMEVGCCRPNSTAVLGGSMVALTAFNAGGSGARSAQQSPPGVAARAEESLRNTPDDPEQRLRSTVLVATPPPPPLPNLPPVSSTDLQRHPPPPPKPSPTPP